MILGKIASVSRERFQFFFERTNCGTTPYLERYIIPQYLLRIVKMSFGKSKFCLGI